MKLIFDKISNKILRAACIALAISLLTLGLGIAFHVLSKKVIKAEDYQEICQKNLSKYEKEILDLFSDASFIHKIKPNKDKVLLSKDFINKYIDKPYTVFLYDNADMSHLWYWNNNKIYPNDVSLIVTNVERQNNEAFEKNNVINKGLNLGDIQTLCLAKNIALVENGVNKSYLLMAILPIYNSYTKKIEPSLLDTKYGNYIEIIEEKALQETEKILSIKNELGEEIIYLKDNPSAFNSNLLCIADIFYVLSWFAAAIAAYYLAHAYFKKTDKFLPSLTLLIFLFSILRLIIWLFKIPHIDEDNILAVLQNNFLIDLDYWFSDTLGYFILDVFLFSTGAYFLHWHLKPRHLTSISKKPLYIWLYTGFVYSFIALECWILTNLVKHVVYDNDISFQFHNLSYLSLNNIIAISAMMTLLIELLMHNYTLIKQVNHIPFPKTNKLALLCIVSFMVLWIQLIFGEDNKIAYVEFCAYVLIVLIIEQINKAKEITIHYLAGYILFFSIYSSFVLYYSTIAKAEKEYKNYATIIADERDRELEVSLKDIMKSIKENHRVRNFYTVELPRTTIEKEIESRYLTPAFFRRYEYTISFYDTEYNPYGKEPQSYNEYRKVIQATTVTTVEDEENIFFCPSERERYTYVARIEITNLENKFSGYIIIQLKPIDKNIYNDIFANILSVAKSKVDRFAEKNEVALYKKEQRIWTSKNNILPGTLPKINLKPETYSKYFIGKNEIMAYSNKEGHTALIVCKEYGLKYFFNIGVFVLCTALLSLLIIWICFSILAYFLKSIQIFTWDYKQTLTANIQFTIFSVLLFSLVLISYVTVSNFNEENLEHYRDDLLKKLEISSHFVTKEYLTNQRENKFTFDVLGLQKITQFNVHIYDKQGMLDRASGENIFDKSWIGRQMNPRALDELKRLNTSIIIENEAIGSLKYLSAYIPLKSDKVIIGYLNFLFNIEALSETEREKDEEFLGSLLRTYAAILLVAAILSFFFARTITRKLRDISNRLKNVSLNQKNEPLEISGSQEISELVERYNQMILDLEENKQILEKTQRESAWRDMAKQVAHEIKNPLTPMKLKIQMLERLMKTDPAKAQAKFEHLSKGIVEQIDNLAAIASEFSNFAQMPPPNNEVFEINELADSTVHLFQDTEYYHINFNPNDKSILVYADKLQILRVLNNLIKNATQAIDDERQGLIDVSIDYAEDKVFINVSDNGIGITEEVQTKIFSPYFTSKSSGTGIGLYMCKNIVMNAHGAIYFKSKEGEGTTFTVELPVHKV